MTLPDRSRLFDALFDAEDFAEVTRELAQAIGARSFLGGFASDDGTRSATVDSGYWSAEQIDRYYSDYFHLDPWNQVALSDWRPFRALELSHQVRPREVERSQLYQEFFRPLGDDTFWVASICTETGSGRGAIGFQRGKDQPGFDADAIKLLDQVAADYARVLALRGQLQGMERAILNRSDALDALHDPVLMLTADGRIVFVNRAGVSLLERGDVLRQRNGRLAGATLAGDRLLTATLAAMPDTGAAGLRIAGAGGQALDCSLLALPPAAGRARVMMSIAAPPLPGRAGLLRAIYGLSAGEAEIALLLADGLDPADIAAARATSLHTVRAQLRAIAEKMECKRQIDIVRRIAALPRLVGNFQAS